MEKGTVEEEPDQEREETQPAGASLEEALRSGAKAIESWRAAHPDTRITASGLDLTECDLSRADLRSALLIGTKLARVDLDDARLDGATLHDADLRGASLERASLEGANLNRAVLEDARLVDARLAGAKMCEVQLEDARLDRADLTNVDLSGARSLFGWQLRGACVTGATLAKEIEEFDSLDHVGELSKASRNLFLTSLLACVYVMLTIGTTTHLDLLLNSGSSTLPVINAKLPVLGFYFVAPLFLCGLYLYTCIYLQRLWEALSDLPAYFPDGVTLDRKAHPWLLSGLVRIHLPLLRRWQWPFSRLQAGLSVVLAYWVMPITLFAVWLRCIARHDLLLTGVHLAVLGVALAGALAFGVLRRSTLRGETVIRPGRTARATGTAPQVRTGARRLFDDDGRAARTWPPLLRVPSLAGICLLVLLVLGSFSWTAFSRPWVFDFTGRLPLGPSRLLKDLVRLDVHGERLSTVQGGASEIPDDLQGVVGPDLSRRNLRGANLGRAELPGAWLSGADLTGANLVDADLRRARLVGATLRSAVLDGAKLQFSELWTTDFEGASLREANLTDARLLRTNLSDADLRGSDVSNSTWKYVNVADADARFRGQPAVMEEPRGKDSALWPSHVLRELELKPDHNEGIELPRPRSGNDGAFDSPLEGP